MKRHALMDEHWALIEPELPRSAARTGRKPRDRRLILDGIFWILHTGAAWRDLPDRFGPWQTTYHHFAVWRRAGVFDRILRRLQIRLDREGRIDWNLWCIDSTNIRAARAAAGASKKPATPTSRTITHWVAAEAGSAPNCIWSLTARGRRSSPRSRPANDMKTRASSRCSTAS